MILVTVSIPLKLCPLLRSIVRSFIAPAPVTDAAVIPNPTPVFSTKLNTVSFVILLERSFVFT